ncbi:hypothetical protein CAPTEDRAFT_192111 [Capitella teleta]|uniref:Uncharacterized protein n=1 Tax=Capitella teleta TaxID=283909 RepID=R7TQZ1_CAPTE|nr:hypothetical protein CAPTEDRAFT_192111 [Capitella teleta]|eukprot:ELT96303.1 hypothetical protein CAPTEDRAFT_192111 [Capitella teleta]
MAHSNGWNQFRVRRNCPFDWTKLKPVTRNYRNCFEDPFDDFDFARSPRKPKHPETTNEVRGCKPQELSTLPEDTSTDCEYRIKTLTIETNTTRPAAQLIKVYMREAQPHSEAESQQGL